MAIGSDISYPSSSTIDTARSIATTIRKNLRDIDKNAMRKRILPALVQRDGGIEYNVSGAGVDWPMQDRIHDEAPNDGTNRREFVPQNLWRQANLQFGGTEVKDSIKKGEMLANRGREAIIRVAGDMKENLENSIGEKFAPHYYDDGDSTSFGLYGFNSFCAVKQATSVDQSFNWGTAGATPSNSERNLSVNDPIVVPGDQYAGLYTNLGYYGGAQQSGGWPEGIADTQFDAWVPLLINTNSTFFGSYSSGTGWQDNGDAAIRFGLLHAKRNTVRDEINIILMDRTLLYQLRELMLTNSPERVLVTSESGVRSYGFKQVFEIDGVECSTEYGIPTTNAYRTSTATVVRSAYGFSTKNIKIMSRFGTLFHPDEAFGEYTKETQSFDYCLETICQFKFRSPRNFIKWAGWSATS